MSVSELLDGIKYSRGYQNQIVHIEDMPAREPEYTPIELKPLVNYALDEMGIEKLYSHQVEAIEKVRSKKDIVISTGTASGKSLSYMIPIFENIMGNKNSTALYISPLNALINDQHSSFTRFRDLMGIDTGIHRYVGTMSAEEKRAVRYGNSNVLFTNPEMIHLSFLQWHHLWKKFFSNLKYIVIDESHYYRGVVGSNMANLLRRFNRVCDHYGSKPQYICCTATIGNPEEHTSSLVDRDVEIIKKDGSGKGPQKFVFWNPPQYVNEKGFNLRKSSFSDSCDLFTRCVQSGLQTIAFTRARQSVERMHVAARRDLRERGVNAEICPYRGGYFGEQREGIEQKLADGNIRGVISTNALELGIDIGGLDACIIDGYPGTVMSTKQQAGRAGRGNMESVVALVAGSNALDQYYMRHPRHFFDRASEDAVINVSNPYIQAGHVLCAARELPLKEEDGKYFGSGLPRIVDLFEEEGLITGDEKKTVQDPNPHMHVSIRGIDRDAYSIYTFRGRKRVSLEKDIETSQALREAFEGAIYIHMGTPYRVSRMDHEKKEIIVEESKVDYYTRAMIASEIFIKEKDTQKELTSSGDVTVGIGEVDVVEQVKGFRRIQNFSDKDLGENSLHMPEHSLETVALWLELPERYNEMVESAGLDFAGGIHAIEHAMIAMYPLKLLADRNDVGGVSTPSHADLQSKSAIFIYDGHRGGVGYAEKGYELIEELLEVTLNAIEDCSCVQGCPGCIQSPKCGNNNKPLDKHAAIMILHDVLGKAPYIPPKVKPVQKKTGKHISERAPRKTSEADIALNRVRQKLRREEVKSIDEWIKMGQGAKDHRIAYEYFEKALSINPHNANALYNKGIACMNLRKYQEAISCYDRMIKRGHRKPIIFILKARAMNSIGNYKYAIQVLEEALKLDPENKEAVKLKAICEKEQQKIRS